eukprot:CAMPEP_0113820110 /NCGR_PEP_ID=MMETSP0328-20130328/1075_1 /TAXON_ID=39455 /ORGANISM="Alexandrium minutum" /LENGTH=206 /DNA_ID=CAMNT_0000788043 /DNA_START=24 /DNA_END=644 /DNA_ORIENTATION=+ /assembly_acc=CAM_ASM_000350
MFAVFGKDGWVDDTLTFPEFMEEKQKFVAGDVSSRLKGVGSLPQLVLGSGKVMCQALCIARWACQKGNAAGNEATAKLYPADPDVAFRVEEVAAFVFEALDKCPQDADAEKKKTLREAYAKDGLLRKVMGLMEVRLQETPGPFLLGEEASLADYAVYTLSSMIDKGDFDHVDKAYVDEFPIVKAHMSSVQGSKLFQDYVAAYGKEP